jgi:hypothetical protein
LSKPPTTWGAIALLVVAIVVTVVVLSERGKTGASPKAMTSSEADRQSS